MIIQSTTKLIYFSALINCFSLAGAGFIKMEEELTKPRETAGSIFKVEDHHKV